MDEPDFAAVYERHAQDVYRFSLYLSGDFAHAQDLTAETFARAWAARDRIRVDSVKAYLLMIARNLYRDERRRPPDISLPEHYDAADHGAGPEALAQARHEPRRVLRALREIPESDRAVLLMATFEGLSHQTIAVRSACLSTPSKCVCTAPACASMRHVKVEAESHDRHTFHHH